MGRAYSRDKEVMDHVTDMVPLVCVLVVTEATLSDVFFIPTLAEEWVYNFKRQIVNNRGQ
ncbi:hypothetical protein QJS10_CPA01g01402 [Acorus calamus]|uniref:Uncharacterized protein n=1 Tax=Acorus calamus TaxID=4465 RepID=A0AAV9FLM1_ACOCL|nr:hypothetical protein QJS10_CPA01g01402 [Acorus calamus]